MECLRRRIGMAVHIVDVTGCNRLHSWCMMRSRQLIGGAARLHKKGYARIQRTGGGVRVNKQEAGVFAVPTRTW